MNLFKLIRGLERLAELENIALEDFSVRVAAQPGLDQVEVRLIYPTRLREVLELPGQAQTMLFESISGVTEQMLEAARERVLARESTAEFFQSMVARKDWLMFLEDYYRPSFALVDEPFHERQDALDSRRDTLSDEDYLNDSNRVLQERQVAISALALLLTRQIASAASIPG